MKSKLYESLLWKLLSPSLAVAWEEGRKAGAAEYWDDAAPSNPYLEDKP